MHRSPLNRSIYLALATVLIAIVTSTAFAHCDTMNGPVVKSAQRALATKNVNHVLIWVEKKDDAEVKAAFAQVLKVRRLSRDARLLADKYFFETVVRLHRTNEGEPYSGIKPVGTEIEPIIKIMDDAIETGSSTRLLTELPANERAEIEKQFNVLIVLKNFDVNDVEAGRAYVKNYVTFIHKVEKLHEGA
jgi:hypothetical protein